MATHSSTLAWKIPWMEEPGRLQSMASQELDTTERLHFHALEKGMATHSGVLAFQFLFDFTSIPCNQKKLN